MVIAGHGQTIGRWGLEALKQVIGLGTCHLSFYGGSGMKVKAERYHEGDNFQRCLIRWFSNLVYSS